MTIINYAISDKEALTAACMPFISRGSLFFKGHFAYPVGTLLDISLQLPDDGGLIQFAGQVIWLTPKYERDQWPEGMGVQFSEQDAKRVRASIEAIVVDAFALMNSNFFNP